MGCTDVVAFVKLPTDAAVAFVKLPTDAAVAFVKLPEVGIGNGI
jgi:hypothetical protein